MTVGKNTRHWEGKPDSFAVEDVAGIRACPRTVRATSPVKLRIDQNNESDMAFLGKLAERNGATFYHRNRKLYFGPRQNEASDVVELEWGQGLSRSAPRPTSPARSPRCGCTAGRRRRASVVLGRARAACASPGATPAPRAAPSASSPPCPPTPVLNMRAAVTSQAEADARAKAVLEERAQDFVTGNGESVGMPEILPDTNSRSRGLGRAFSKTYYVSEATHTLDGNGYRTTFTVQETTV